MTKKGSNKRVKAGADIQINHNRIDIKHRLNFSQNRWFKIQTRNSTAKSYQPYVKHIFAFLKNCPMVLTAVLIGNNQFSVNSGSSGSDYGKVNLQCLYRALARSAGE